MTGSSNRIPLAVIPAGSKPGSTGSIKVFVAQPNERPSKIVRDAFKALKIAVAKALADHKLHGDPIYVWEKGKVVRIPPNRIRVSHAR